MPSDPPISRRRAEAIKPFVDAALAAEQDGTLDLFALRRGGLLMRGFTARQWRELVDAFKPDQ